MKIADDLPSLPFPPDRHTAVSCETLSKIDWSHVLRFHAREPHSDDDTDDSSPRADEPERCPEGTFQVAARSFLSGSNLFLCCAARACATLSPGREYKPGTAGSPRKPRQHSLPIPHSSNLSNPGALPQQGPIKLHTGPIISHPALPKAAIKSISVPSIIPTDFVGKKKPPGYGNEEPTSPEVTCLGQVKVKEKQYKQIGKSADKMPNKSTKKKAPSSPSGKTKQSTSKQPWAARQSMERKRGSGRKELGIDLGRFSPDHRAVPSNAVYSRGERGALLTAALVHVLAEIGSRRGEGIETEYVPQVPPPNSLLLIRASRNFERGKETTACELPDNIPVPVAVQSTNLLGHVSLPKPSPEVCIWKRRSIAQPSDLDVRRPIKLQTKKPTTR